MQKEPRTDYKLPLLVFATMAFDTGIYVQRHDPLVAGLWAVNTVIWGLVVWQRVRAAAAGR